jgi:hypothetical protein
MVRKELHAAHAGDVARQNADAKKHRDEILRIASTPLNKQLSKGVLFALDTRRI